MHEWATGLPDLANRRATAGQLGLVAGIRRTAWQSHDGGPMPEPLDAWDHAPATANYLLCSGNSVVGAVRTIVHDGRHAQRQRTVYQDLGPEILDRIAGARFLEADRLCVLRRPRRPEARLVLALLQNVTADLDGHGCAWILTAATLYHQAFFVSMGLRPVSPPRACTWSSEPVTLLLGDWPSIREPLRRHWLFGLMFSGRNDAPVDTGASRPSARRCSPG